MMTIPLKLYDLTGQDDRCRFSPNCWPVHMSLAHKGLAFETIPWRFTEKEKIAQSGQGTVPVLIDGQKIIHDRWTIGLYLDETYPNRPLLMDGPQARAHALFAKRWYESELLVKILKIILKELFDLLHEDDKEYFRTTRERAFGIDALESLMEGEQAVPSFRQALEPLRRTLKDQPFVGGEVASFADYVVFGGFMWARSVSRIELLDENDRVHHWREHLLDLHGGLARKAFTPS